MQNIISIVERGYQDNLKPAFFNEKNSRVQKVRKRETNDFYTRRSFYAHKKELPLLFFVRLFLFLLVNVCL